MTPYSASQDMSLFTASIDMGGFSAAAKAFGLTPSAVSRAVTRLETRLGARLLYRTTRQLVLTPDGEIYFHRAKQILADIDEAEALVTQGQTKPRGLLRVNVGFAFGMHQLLAVLPEFRERYPELELSLDVTDKLVDLMHDHVDVAIRSGQLPDSSFVVRKISDMVRVICASPAYLQRRGTPQTPEDLLHHSCLLLSESPALSRWPFAHEAGLNRSVVSGVAPQVRLLQVAGPISASSVEPLLQMALDGMGIIRLGDVIAGQAIASGRLVPLLQDWHYSEPVPFNAVMPPGRQRSAKVRVFIDFLLEKFSHAPWSDYAKRAAPAE